MMGRVPEKEYYLTFQVCIDKTSPAIMMIEVDIYIGMFPSEDEAEKWKNGFLEVVKEQGNIKVLLTDKFDALLVRESDDYVAVKDFEIKEHDRGQERIPIVFPAESPVIFLSSFYEMVGLCVSRILSSEED